MVTIHAGESFSFPRPYIAGFAVFAEDISASFEPPYITITNEVDDWTLVLEVYSEIYPARSRSYLLHEVFIESGSSYVVEGLPSDLDVYVTVDRPDKDTDFCFCIKISSVVETFVFVNLPDMPPGYWRPETA